MLAEEYSMENQEGLDIANIVLAFFISTFSFILDILNEAMIFFLITLVVTVASKFFMSKKAAKEDKEVLLR